PNYLAVHGLAIIQGRDFQPGDVAGNGVAILNAVAAQRLYPHGAIGHMVKLGGPAKDAPWIPIIGGSRNAMVLSGGSDDVVDPELYVAAPDGPMTWASILARSTREDPQIAVALRRAVHTIPNTQLISMQPYTYGRDGEITSRRFLAGVFVTM